MSWKRPDDTWDVKEIFIDLAIIAAGIAGLFGAWMYFLPLG